MEEQRDKTTNKILDREEVKDVISVNVIFLGLAAGLMYLVFILGNMFCATQHAIISDRTNLSLYVDSETGVNYLIDGENSGTMTVRINEDGTPYISRTADDIPITDEQCIQTIVDPTTGVNYFIYDGDYYKDSLVVRVNVDGTPYVTSMDEISEE